MYVLERLSDARRRGAKIYGEIAGYAMNSDATDFVLPNPQRQAECMQLALRRAGMTAEEIDIVSTHATGTASGDAQECAGPAAGVRRQRPAHAVQQHQELHRPRDGRGRRAWSWPATCPPSTTACATPRSTSTGSIPSAPCRAWWSTSRAKSGGSTYILNNSFGMLGINSVVIVKRI